MTQHIFKKLIECEYTFHGSSGLVHAQSYAQAVDRAKNDWLQIHHKISFKDSKFRLYKSRLLGTPKIRLAPIAAQRFRELYRSVKDGDELTAAEALELKQYQDFVNTIAHKKAA